MTRRFAEVSGGFVGALLVVSGCGLAPSDPSPPLVALWEDNGVLKVAVGTCLGNIERIAMMRVGEDGAPESMPLVEADVSGGGSSVALDELGVDTTGKYSLTERLLIEVETSSALASGVWPGSSAISEPLDRNLVVVDEQVVDSLEFEARACLREEGELG